MSLKEYPLALSLGAATALGSSIHLALKFADLPSSIPIHWNLFGNADLFGSKWWIFLYPMLAIATPLSLQLRRQNPQEPTSFNKRIFGLSEDTYPKFNELSEQYLTMLSIGMCFLVPALQWSSFRNGEGLEKFIPGWLSLLMIGSGVYGYKALQISTQS